MIEIFSDIPDYIKDLTKGWVDLALKQYNPINAVKMLKEFRDSCQNEEERAFVDFYFNLRMEQLKEENN